MQRLPTSTIWLLDILLAPLWLVAVVWVRRRQSQVLRSGIALTPQQLTLARVLGVQHAERVRVVTATPIPLPVPPMARRVAQQAGWISPHIAGMTLGYGIVIRDDCCGDACLLAHELAHVAQYERLGGIAGFLRQYLRECVWPGYPHGVLEVEARAAETQDAVRGSMPR
jgi:hypothetical protein